MKYETAVATITKMYVSSINSNLYIFDECKFLPRYTSTCFTKKIVATYFLGFTPDHRQTELIFPPGLIFLPLEVGN